MATLLANNTVKAALASTGIYEIADTQVRGLQLRSCQNKAVWTVRCRLFDRWHRYDLGKACTGEDAAGAITLKTARNRAAKVRAMCEAGIPPGPPDNRLGDRVGWVAGVVQRLDLMISDNDNPFLFPATNASRTNGQEHKHADIEMLNRALEGMPGVGFSTHGGRYAFSTYGERDLGFAKERRQGHPGSSRRRRCEGCHRPIL